MSFFPKKKSKGEFGINPYMPISILIMGEFMNIKKITAFFLVLSMLAGSLASCNGGETKETEKETNPPQIQTNPTETDAPDVETEPAETKFDRLSVEDGLPEITFDGKDFRFLVNEGEYFQLISEDTDGVGLDSVIYQRNQRVEDRFDVKITAQYQVGTEAQDIINLYGGAGEHIAEVCDHWHRMGLSPVCYFLWLSWLDIPHINLSSPGGTSWQTKVPLSRERCSPSRATFP